MKLREWTLEQLLLETGVRLDPEPDIWGILDKGEEDTVLARLYADKLWLALMRKYAETANRKMVTKALMDQQYWKWRGEFFCYTQQILKARRAFKKIQNPIEQNRT